MESYRRIVTHTDFDGVVSALLIQVVHDLEDIVFAEPWMFQKKKFAVQRGDVIVDLPYGKGCALWFDHHASTEADKEKGVWDGNKPSCARLIYEHYLKTHPVLERFAALVKATDKIDTASFTKTDLESPDAYGKLSIAIRGEEKRKDDEFRRFLINMLGYQNAEDVIKQPIIKKRVDEKMRQLTEWKEHINEYITTYQNVILVDRTRAPADFPRGQNFWLYLMHPGRKVSVSVNNLKYEPENVKISCGENIFEKLNTVDIGALMKGYGGGGHKTAGGCSIPRTEQERVVKEIISAFDDE